MNNIQEQLKGELTSDEVVNDIFNTFESELMDGKNLIIDLEKVTFINVRFLERLEMLTNKAKELNIKISIKNVLPSIYKVFHVARNRDILSLIC